MPYPRIDCEIQPKCGIVCHHRLGTRVGAGDKLDGVDTSVSRARRAGDDAPLQVNKQKIWSAWFMDFYEKEEVTTTGKWLKLFVNVHRL